MEHEWMNKLANVEGQLSVMAGSMQRIEDQLDRVVSLDRSMAEVVLRQSHTADALDHIRRRVDENRAIQHEADNAIASKIETVAAASSRFENRVQGALYVVVMLIGLVGGLGGWILNRVDGNTQSNALQQQRLERLERDLETLKQQRQQTMTLQYVPDRRPGQPIQGRTT